MSHEITDASFGIIPLRLLEGEWEVLVLLQKNGHYWGFPKGHKEEGESSFHAACRELQEETSLVVKEVLSQEILEEKYQFMHKDSKIYKTVQYFPCLVEGSVVIEQDEIEGFLWLKIDEAYAKLTYSNAKELCKKVKTICMQRE